MTGDKEILLRWIEEERDELIDFLSRFIQAKSPSPPGDTREAAAHIRQFLDARGLPYRVVAPNPEMPNILSSFEGGAPGRNLVLNGHMDHLPAGDSAGWSHDPGSGAVAEGRIYGRGVCDMKCGTAASVFTFAYLHRMSERLKGRLTFTAVSDEMTFGPWGSRYLLEHHPEALGDCFLGAEPTSPYVLSFGEKGFLWLAFTVRTPGAHAASPHLSASATKIAARLIADLEALGEVRASPPDNVSKAITQAAETIDQARGKGAADIIQKATVNIGTIRGGLSINTIPGECVIEADIRLPVGLDKERIMEEVERIAKRYPELTVEDLKYDPPSWSDPYGEMARYIQANVKALKGFEPPPIINLGGSDGRLWRYRNVPAYLYGPTKSKGPVDEHVEIEEFLHIVRTHVLSAYDYLRHG